MSGPGRSRRFWLCIMSWEAHWMVWGPGESVMHYANTWGLWEFGRRRTLGAFSRECSTLQSNADLLPWTQTPSTSPSCSWTWALCTVWQHFHDWAASKWTPRDRSFEHQSSYEMHRIPFWVRIFCGCVFIILPRRGRRHRCPFTCGGCIRWGCVIRLIWTWECRRLRLNYLFLVGEGGLLLVCGWVDEG